MTEQSSVTRIYSTLPLLPVSRAAFAPYGQLVAPAAAGLSVEEGNAVRHDIHFFEGSEADARLSLVTSVFEVEGLALPRVIRMLERHIRTTQLIVPISVDDHAVVVCASRPDGTPDPAGLAAFRLGGRQGVILRAGLWHHPILAIGRKGLFLVQSWQDGSRRDRETTRLDPVTLA